MSDVLVPPVLLRGSSAPSMAEPRRRLLPAVVDRAGRAAPWIGAEAPAATAGLRWAGVVVYGLVAALAAVGVGRLFVWPAWVDRPVEGTIALGLVLPIHLHHVAHGLRGRRPPFGRVTLPVAAAVHLVAVLLVGLMWILNLSLLCLSVLIVVPWPVVLVPYAAPVVLATVLGGTYPDAYSPGYYTLAVIWRSLTLFVLVWFAAVIRHLEAARREQRRRAILVERLRLDAEIREVLGTTLERITALGDEAAAAVARADPATPEVLRSLTADAREGLADARGLVARYRRPSAEIGLGATLELLRVAGIAVVVDAPDDSALDELDRTAVTVVQSRLAESVRAGHSELVLRVRRRPGGDVTAAVDTVEGVRSGGVR